MICMTQRSYSLAYLTVDTCTVPEAIDIAAALGYADVGLRLLPNAPGAPHQALVGHADLLRESLARMRDTGVGVYDLEIIRLGDNFEPEHYRAFWDMGAALGARAVLVAADDTDRARLAHNYARLCECMLPYGMTANLEFMPWTAVKNCRDVMEVIDLAGRPANAGLLVDALHFGRSATTLADIAAVPRSLLHYAQICDATAGLNFSVEELIHTARAERALPGEGSIDLTGLFSTLPHDLPISVEVVSHSQARAMGAMAWARLCLEKSQKVLAACQPAQ
jgi:sugar phosphate isomerase/epimerase